MMHFFIISGALALYPDASPRSSLKPGFYSILGGLSKCLLDLTWQFAMESSVVSSVPDHTSNLASRKDRGN